MPFSRKTSVQSIITSYSAQPFAVDVHHIRFTNPASRRIVAIVVPSGLTTPAICKTESAQNQSPSVRKSIIYTRTVEPNGTVSSAPASQRDLENVVEECFDNRVTDIGKFFRRHLTRENVEILHEVTAPTPPDETTDDLESQLDNFATQSIDAFQNLQDEESES